MRRILLRHWTIVLIGAAVVAWAVLYLPTTPTFAVLELKHAIDQRNDEAAARFIDFQSVVTHAGNELVHERERNNLLGQLLGRSAVGMLAAPMAQALEAWARQKVHDGAPEVQMPALAVAGSLLLMHRSGQVAHTEFRDDSGQLWQIRMTRNAQGSWQVVEVGNIGQILARLQQEEERHPNLP